MNNWKKEVDGHIIEYRYGSTGSIDPWSLDFADKNTLWLDAKITKEQAIEIITKLYAGNDYFSLRTLYIIDYETREFKV